MNGTLTRLLHAQAVWQDPFEEPDQTFIESIQLSE